jgi:hypothetical protein
LRDLQNSAYAKPLTNSITGLNDAYGGDEPPQLG